jgi:hypothetical protein
MVALEMLLHLKSDLSNRMTLNCGAKRHHFSMFEVRVTFKTALYGKMQSANADIQVSAYGGMQPGNMPSMGIRTTIDTGAN